MAGVSISSVSRVLNDSKPVNKATKEKVEKVLRETNFRPNALARGLINQATKLIGVIIPRINSVSAQLIEGVESVTTQYGYNILLSNSRADIKQELQALDVYKENRVEGIILSSVKITDEHVEVIRNNSVPVVVVGQKTSDYGLPWVDVDNYSSVGEIVRFLRRSGHEKIAMIHGPTYDRSAGYSRLQGFIDEIQRLGLALDEHYLVESDFTMEQGYQAMERILRMREMPSAIVAASDAIAIGAKNCAEDRGFVIPDDLSIVGFDDIDTATSIRPQLTTVSVSSQDMGSTAARTLFKILKNEGPTEQLEHYVNYRLVLRGTVKNLRQS